MNIIGQDTYKKTLWYNKVQYIKKEKELLEPLKKKKLLKRKLTMINKYNKYTENVKNS